MEGLGTVNTSVTFSCELGYVLNGSLSLTCNPNLTWNGTLPTCTQGEGWLKKDHLGRKSIAFRCALKLPSESFALHGFFPS